MEEIFVNTQSSIYIKNKYNIYIDPYLIQNSSKDADFIFITHNHYDHFSKDDISKVINENTKVFVPSIIKEEFIDDSRFFAIEPNKEYLFKDMKVKTLYSYNINKPYHKKCSDNLGFLITVNNRSYYIVGDSDINPDIINVKADVLFVPIGGTYTMNYKEGAELSNIIKPKLVIPTHYGSIVGNKNDGEKFSKLLDKGIEYKLFDI